MPFPCRLAVIATFGIFLLGCSGEKDEFLAALANVPRSNVDHKSGVTRVVQEQFPPGSDVKAALLFLERRGFEVFPSKGKHVPPEQKWFIAERRESYRFIHTETIRVIVESDGKQVLNARGIFFLK